MMTDTAVCEGCGVDVRDESSFCYNCGKRVAARLDSVLPPAVSEHPVEKDMIATAETEIEPAAALPRSKPPLRSAASLRKQRRALNRQPVEVRWERPTGLGIGFILTAILLSTVVLVLMVIALYLR